MYTIILYSMDLKMADAENNNSKVSAPSKVSGPRGH